MTLPSFSLQFTLALSDPRWGVRVSSFFCISWVVLVLCLGWRSWEGSRLLEVGSEVSHE